MVLSPLMTLLSNCLQDAHYHMVLSPLMTLLSNCLQGSYRLGLISLQSENVRP